MIEMRSPAYIRVDSLAEATHGDPNDPLERTYADYVREVRVAGGFTQQQIADRLGVDRTTWARWEGSRHAPLPMFRRVIEKLGTDFRVPAPPRPAAPEVASNGNVEG